MVTEMLLGELDALAACCSQDRPTYCHPSCTGGLPIGSSPTCSATAGGRSPTAYLYEHQDVCLGLRHTLEACECQFLPLLGGPEFHVICERASGSAIGEIIKVRHEKQRGSKNQEHPSPVERAQQGRQALPTECAETRRSKHEGRSAGPQ